MEELRIIVSCDIEAGKADEFKTTAGQLLSAVREKDSGTSSYDWFMTEDGSRAKVQESYVSSDALMEHMGNMGRPLEHIISICSKVSIEVMGDPSPKVQEALAPFKPTIYSDAFQSL